MLKLNKTLGGNQVEKGDDNPAMKPEGTPIQEGDIKDITEKLNPPAIQSQNQIVPADKGEKILGLDKFRESMIETGRLVLPYLKLVQSMSDDATHDDIKPGNFRNSLTGEDLGTEVLIYPIAVFHWRRFFEDRRVLCSSNDALQGYGDPGGECKICPLQKWHVIRENGQEEVIQNSRTFRAKKGEEMVAPLCSEQWVFPSLILNSQWEVPGALVFHRSYLQEGLRLGSLVEWTPRDTSFNLTSVKTTNDKGTWYVPRITIGRKLTPEEDVIASRFRTNLREAVVDIDVEEETE